MSRNECFLKHSIGKTIQIKIKTHSHSKNEHIRIVVVVAAVALFETVAIAYVAASCQFRHACVVMLVEPM